MTLKPPDGVGNPLVTVTTLQGQLNHFPICVKDDPYSAMGDGTTDDTTAVQAAITAGGTNGVYFPRGTYIVSNLSNVRRIVGDGRGVSIIKAKSTVSSGVLIGGLSGATAGYGWIKGVTINGNRAGGATCSCLFASSPNRFTVEDIEIINFFNQGIFFDTTATNCLVRNTYVTNCGNAAITPIVGYSTTFEDLTTAGNAHTPASSAVVKLGGSSVLRNSSIAHASAVSNKGVFIAGNDVTIEDCTITVPSSATNQSGYGISSTDTESRLRIHGNRISATFGSGIIVGQTATRCQITSNVIEDACSDGILVGTDATTATGSDNVVANNTVRNVAGGTLGSGQEDIGIESQLARTTVTGNTCESIGGHGIYIIGRGSTITGNTLKGCAQHFGFAANAYRAGIAVANNDCVIANNTVQDGGTAALHAVGIYISAQTGGFNITSCTIIGNRCFDTRGGSALQDYGLYTDGSGGNTVSGLRMALNDFATNALGEYSFTTGTTSAVPTVASAATIALPDTRSDVITISGVTTITSVTATGHAGRTVTLIFAGILTFTDGSNLKLAGNFVTTADDTITLSCDGTNWYEVARAVN